MARPRRYLRPPGAREEGLELPATPPAEAPIAPAPPPEAPIDWLGIPGLPPDVLNRIDAIFRDGSPNPVERAMAYLRSTPWYADTYRGIGQGVAKGIIGGEADYRAYVNQVNQHYRQFYGRDATGDEIEAFLTAGYTPGVIGQIGQGKAYVDANKGDIQYLSGAFGEGQLSGQELQTYGEQVVGRESTLGASIQSKVNFALRKMQRVFEGQLATSPLALDSLSQSQQRQRKPDIAA